MELIKSSKAGEIWQQFADAWGSEVILKAYAWEVPPKSTRDLEIFYEAYNDGVLVGWGSLTKHPLDAEYFLSLGIFPGFVDQHLFRPLKNQLAELAFSMGAQTVTSHILDSNPEHQNNTMSRCEKNKSDGWKYAGQVWFPLGYKVFSVTRELCPGCKQVLNYCRCCGGQGFVFDH